MQLVIAIDDQSTSTLQAQIYDQIRRMICDRLILMGAPLPSTRALAKQLALSRNTVMLAYSRLADEGYITFRPTQGTYVNHRLPDECISVSSPVTAGLLTAGLLTAEPLAAKPLAAKPLAANPLAAQSMASEEMALPRVRFKGSPHRVVSPHRSRSVIDFWPGVPDRASFPMAAWKKGLIRNFESAGTVLTEYCDPLGMPELREAIAAHLGPSRGMKVEPDQIIVVTSTQMALNVISRLIVAPSAQVVMEDPCYEGAANVFESYGGRLYPVAVDENGLRTDELPQSGVALAYVTPSHQYPYGYTMSSDRRRALLDWAERTQSYLVEDDYDADFHFSGSPLPSLAALDTHQRVFHLGTFSKSLGPGVRVGFMVVPRPMLAQAAAAKTLMDHGSSWLEQSVLAGFLKSGAYSAHLRKIRRLYADRLGALKEALNACQLEAELMGEQCGMHVVWKLPQGARSASEIALAALRRGVAVYPIDRCFSRIFVPRADQDRMLILGYAAISERYIEEGVSRIARHAFMH